MAELPQAGLPGSSAHLSLHSPRLWLQGDCVGRRQELGDPGDPGNPGGWGRGTPRPRQGVSGGEGD